MIIQMLQNLGVHVAYIGTLGYISKARQYKLQNTTPDVITLYSYHCHHKYTKIEFKTDQKYQIEKRNVVIDYAHTLDAVLKMITTFKEDTLKKNYYYCWLWWR